MPVPGPTVTTERRSLDHDAFARDGVLVVRGLVGRSLIDRVRSDARRVRAGSGAGPKVENAWTRSDPIRDLAAHPAVLAVLEDLYGRRPIPFQTLNFERGSQQRLHADSIHFDSVPSGLMCGVWVALEDVGPDQGPVTYVPGSHRFPPVASMLRYDGEPFDYDRYEDAVAEQVAGRPIVQFHAEPGDVLVWAADLLHGGAPVVDAHSTRASQVTHYFFEGSSYVTPMKSAPAAGEFALRDPLIDISTGRRVRPTADGLPLRVVRLRSGRVRILRPEEPAPPTRARVESTFLGIVVEARWLLARRRARTR